MNSKIKPASRLSIVFILAVVISGGILTYFSITNISNLKNLTEKRILEEQRVLSTRFSDAIQKQIETLTLGFKSELNPPGILKDSLINTAINYDYVRLPFILRNDGSLLYPNFAAMSETLLEASSSNRFRTAFKKGEEAEFINLNLRTAKAQYLLCLNYSIGETDRVKALNALGRVSVRLSHPKEAFSHYKKIIVAHYLQNTPNGFPYVYYAIPQLLKISNPDNQENILSLINSCLDKMERGLIPLNFSTEELLASIRIWQQDHTFAGTEMILHNTALGEKISQQLKFTIEYGNEVSRMMREGALDNHAELANNFKAINPFSGNNQHLILINLNLSNAAGFLLDREKLLAPLLKQELQSGFEFEYKIQFPDGYQSSINGQDLIYTTQLNPYFPGQSMQIMLKDENLIKDMISRKSWVYGIATVLLLVAMFLGVALIIRDSAREKYLARLQSDFISNVTHELKTPLTSIYMYAESLKLGRVKTTSEEQEYLSVILKESERLKRMINNILEFSKIEDGKAEYNFESKNLASIIKATIADMNYWFEEENFKINTQLDEDITAKLDSEKMHQLFSNLLNNAFKYSGDTKEISIRLFKKNNQIHIEIEDHGIGMAEEQLSRIFEKFYRINQNESISGTGLGLTVVKEISDAHQANILVSSKLGKGSIFSVILNQ